MSTSDFYKVTTYTDGRSTTATVLIVGDVVSWSVGWRTKAERLMCAGICLTFDQSFPGENIFAEDYLEGLVAHFDSPAGSKVRKEAGPLFDNVLAVLTDLKSSLVSRGLVA